MHIFKYEDNYSKIWINGKNDKSPGLLSRIKFYLHYIYKFWKQNYSDSNLHMHNKN